MVVRKETWSYREIARRGTVIEWSIVTEFQDMQNACLSRGSAISSLGSTAGEFENRSAQSKFATIRWTIYVYIRLGVKLHRDRNGQHWKLHKRYASQSSWAGLQVVFSIRCQHP